MRKTGFSIFSWFALVLLMAAPGIGVAASAVSGGGDGLYGSYQYCGSGYTSSATCSVATTMSRIDPTINYSGTSTTVSVSGTNSWNLSSTTTNTYDPVPGSVTSPGFRVTWTGELYAPVEGQYTIYVQASDGIAIYLNGAANTGSTTLTTTPLSFVNSSGTSVDAWANSSVGNELHATITLNANSYNMISIVYRDDSGTSPTAIVKWQGTDANTAVDVPSEVVIPQSYLYSGVDRLGDGLLGSYYSVAQFDTAACNYGQYWAPGTSTGVDNTNYAMATGSSNASSYASCTATIQRVDPTINLSYTSASTNPPDPSMAGSNWGTVWTGSFLAPETGTYSFEIPYEGSLRFFMDNDSSAVLSGESGAPATETPLFQFQSTWDSDVSGTAGPATQTVHLTAGTSYKMLIEYRHITGGTASIDLEYTHPSSPTTYSTVPVDFLYSDSAAMLSGAGTTTCTVGTKVQVYFFVAMSSEAAVVSNYALATTSGGTAVGLSSATLSADGMMVTLTTAANLTAGTSYTLTVNNVQDTLGDTITPNSTITFTPQTITEQSGVVGDYFDQEASTTSQVPSDFFNYQGGVDAGQSRRVDPYIDFWWQAGSNCSPDVELSPPFPNGDTGSNVTRIVLGSLTGGFGTQCWYYTVRWFGQVLANNGDGLYYFTTQSDDGARLVVNNQILVNDFSPHTWNAGSPASGRGKLDTGSIWMKAGTWYDLRLEYFNRTNQSVIALSYCTTTTTDSSSNPASTPYCSSIIPNADLRTCSPFDHFNIFPTNNGVAPTGYAGSTCTAKAITIQAVDASGNVYSGYTGTVLIQTSDNLGVWTKSSTANGTLVTNGLSTGWAEYTFVAADNGVVTLDLAETHADSVNVTVVDLGQATSLSSMTSPIAFSKNTFLITDLSSQYAGLPQQITVTAQKQDPSTGLCSTLTDYTGNKPLRAWLTLDAAYTSTTNTALATALTAAFTSNPPTLTDSKSNKVTLSSTQPTSDNMTLSFTNGVATAAFPLNSTDVGAYILNLLDADSTTNTASPFSGVSSEIYLPPFYFGISGTGLTQGSSSSGIGSSGATNGLVAGVTMPAITVTPYLWNSAMDSSTADTIANPATLITSATSTQIAAATASKYVIPHYYSTTTTITIPTQSWVSKNVDPGTLASPSCTSCVLGGSTSVTWASSNGTYVGTASGLLYPEVGYVLLGATDSNFVGESLASAPITTAAATVGWAGRFVPDHYLVTGVTTTVNGNTVGPVWNHQSDTFYTSPAINTACSPTDTSSYIGEWYTLDFNITPQNFQGSGLYQYQSASGYQKLGGGNGTMSIVATGVPALPASSSAVPFVLNGTSAPAIMLDSATGLTSKFLFNTVSYPYYMAAPSSTSSSGLSFNVRITPLSSNISYGSFSGVQFGVKGSDMDGVPLTSGPSSPASGEFSMSSLLSGSSKDSVALGGQYKAYLGRAKLVDTYGSSAGNSLFPNKLAMPVRFELYNSAGYWYLPQTSVFSLCSIPFALADVSYPTTSSVAPYTFGMLSVTPALSSTVKMTTLAPVLSQTYTDNLTTTLDEGYLWFTNASASQSGSLSVTLNVPDYLQFDWTGSGSSSWSTSGTCGGTNCPSANLTFGIFSDKNAGTANTGQVIYQLQSQ